MTKTVTNKCERCKKEFETDDPKIRWCSDECKEKFKVCYCKKCDKEFLSYVNRAFCSDECKRKPCFQCNRIFLPKNSEIYCSMECKIKRYTHKCVTCEKEFFKQQPNAKYCSKECRGVYETSKKFRRICKFCKNVILVTSHNLLYCNEHCMNQYRKKKEREQELKNSSFQELEQLIRLKVNELIDRKYDCLSMIHSTIDYNEKSGFTDSLKQEVFERDEHKCYICHDDKHLEVHHKLPQRLGGKHEVDNLITLCRRCHRHIETGNREHAIRKCLRNARLTYGMESIVMKEKYSHNSQLQNIQQELEHISKLLTGQANDELQESLMLLDDLLDEVSSYQASK